MDYRLRPLQEHMKRSIQEAHYAGKQAALQGAVVSGVLTAPFLAHRLVTDEAYTWKQAGTDYTKIVATSAVSTYVVTGATVLIQGQLRTSSHAFAKQLVKSNAVGQLLTSSIDLSKQTYRLMNDPDYELVDFLTDTSEHVTGTIASAFLTTAVVQTFPTMNPLLLTVPGMIGYLAGQYIVKSLIQFNEDTKLAKTKRIEIESICAEMTEQLDALHRDMKKIGEREMATWESIQSIMINLQETTSLTETNRLVIQLAERFNIALRMTDFNEFDEMMSNPNIPFKF